MPSDKTFAVRSPKSVCLTDTKPSFLQFIQYCILNLLAQGHIVGKFAMHHPYRQRTTSQKCCFHSSKPKSPCSSIVSSLDTSFSMLIISFFLDFFDKSFFNWSRLVRYQSSLWFLIPCLAILTWVLSYVYCLLWFLTKDASWAVSFLFFFYCH